MDGFLVRPVGETHPSVKKMSGIPYRELRIISNITAGHGVATVAEHCDATYVTTGTLVENADLAVVKIEDCDVSGDTVIVPVTGVVAGLNLRSVGSDIKKDELIARRGAVLTPALLAALEGVSAIVELLPVVKIAIVSSGDELVKKEVPDTNGPMLQGLLCERFGNAVEVNRLLPLEDDYNVIRKVLLEVAATNDVVITTGAVSKGSKDYIKKILEKDGKVHFGEVCLKPGKPTTFATLRETPFFGLPGNPASAYVTFFVFVEPFLRALLTADGKMENFQQFYATVAENMQQTDPMRPEYVRVTASVTPSGQIVASGTTGGDTQRSSRLLSCVGVNALVKLPAGGELVHKGARVPCVLTGRAELGNGGEDEVDDDVKAEAFAFRRLVSWLQTRTDVQNIDLMNLAGFCRNCLSKWYAEGRGVDVDEAKERVYGEESNYIYSYSNTAQVVVVPDEILSIQSAITDLRVHHGCNLVITTGGTGFAPRDVTPEAVVSMIEKRATGIEHMLLRCCRDRSKSGKFVYLSRPVAGVLKGDTACLVVTLPGSRRAVEEILGDSEVVDVLMEAARIAVWKKRSFYDYNSG
ncbi:Molybdopterin biosynthesis protein moeA, putative [Perkinsus marinus ATCC 50983]|uniref:Molybdopterin biosynthesis protein moeA, putative n=1 Tax=Perkinsus marinus (strain ATCC 50983 / TXsc) TaxID=423536 RepID=C5M119_PERM5|nr:Molybdopterin biosynthesis protein moeA, putative [Perkinsus marinus ATCC 50983]EEQ97249.1 Molybdopterin biosynthesis protein moeA, putative [Perkinsus marinus ATCC 50983]|eukprot:XP_002764532.1 Molybdopterin biosynthesis protein moeA, putative [Perkinsus marinus ATCC 50983]